MDKIKIDYSKGFPTRSWCIGYTDGADPEIKEFVPAKQAVKGSDIINLKLAADPSQGLSMKQERGLKATRVVSVGPHTNEFFYRKFFQKPILQAGDEVILIPNPAGGYLAMENIHDPQARFRFQATDVLAIKEKGIWRPAGPFVFIERIVLRYFNMPRKQKSKKEESGYFINHLWHDMDGLIVHEKLKERDLYESMGRVIACGHGISTKHPLTRHNPEVFHGAMPFKPGDIVGHMPLINEHGNYVRGAEMEMNGIRGFIVPFEVIYWHQPGAEFVEHFQRYEKQVADHKERLTALDNELFNS